MKNSDENMNDFNQALAKTRAAMETSRDLALQIWAKKQAGVTDPKLSQELKHAQELWDQCSARAAEQAPNLKSFQLARRLAPKDGSAHSTIPNYLSNSPA